MAECYSKIRVEVAPPAARIILSHAPLNVIDLPMMEELSAAIGEIESNPDLIEIVLSGEGKAFSGGVDIPSHRLETVAQMLKGFHALILQLARSQKITIAAVHGACLGGGAELAMICDFVYTTRKASWGFPEIQLGCYPPVACAALAALVGQRKAADLVLTGTTFSGADAIKMGLATAAAESEAAVRKLADRKISQLQKLSPVALRLAKKAMYFWDSMHFDKGLARAEKIYLEELIATEDAREGVNAWTEKRKPAWKGR